MKSPNTEIKCPICKGTKIHHPLSYHPDAPDQCSGLSTAPYDQPRNGTTTGTYVGYDHPLAASGSEYTNDLTGWVRLQKDLDPTFTADISLAYRLLREIKGLGKVHEGWAGILVSRENPLYVERLELDKKGELYP